MRQKVFQLTENPHQKLPHLTTTQPLPSDPLLLHLVTMDIKGFSKSHGQKKNFPVSAMDLNYTILR